MLRLGKKAKAACAGLCTASLLVGTVSCGTVDDWEIENGEGKAEGIADRWELDKRALKDGVSERNKNPTSSKWGELEWAKMQGEDWRELFTTTLVAGDQKIPAPTHLFAPMTGIADRWVPYADQGLLTTEYQESVQMANGTKKKIKGDVEVANMLCDNVGDIGISLKHETQAYNKLEPSHAGENPKEFKEAMKLYDTHIQMWTCVKDDDGKKRVITLNNPTNYAKDYEATDGSNASQEGVFGGFGTRGYGNIFLKFNFDQLAEENKDKVMEDGRTITQALMDNIRTYAVIFNSISWFPSDYDGNDPLAAWSPGTMKEHAATAILAVLPKPSSGEYRFSDVEKARGWWAWQLQQYMYCAELGHLAAGAGLMVPLNKDNVVGMRTGTGVTITQEHWDAFQAVLDAHNAADPNDSKDLDVTYFDYRNRTNTGINHNSVKYEGSRKNGASNEVKVSSSPQFKNLRQGATLRIPMTVAPSNMEPYENYVSAEAYDAAGCGQGDDSPTCMAFNPMTIADMVRYFLALFVPRHTVYQLENADEREASEKGMGHLQANVLFNMTESLYEAMGLNTTKAEYTKSKDLGGMGMSSAEADAMIAANVKAKNATAAAIELITGCADEDRTEDGQCGPSVLTNVHGDYDSFKAALAQDQGYQMAQGIASAGANPYFVPPSLFHIRALGQHSGLMNLDYVAHGLHFSLFNAKGEAAVEPEPGPITDLIRIAPTNVDGKKGGRCQGLVGICVDYNESQPGGVCQSKVSTVGSKCLGDPSPTVRCCADMIPID